MRFRALLSGSLCLLACGLSAAEFSWPQWRGPDRTDVSQETGLLREWPESGPKLVWTFEDAGVGYSSFAVVDGKLYTLGARNQTEFILCLDLADARELWAAELGPQLKNGYGDGPRGTPTVDGDRVYALGGQGILVCVALNGGSVIWKVDMKDFGGRRPGWGYCESVLVDGNMVVCTPGGGKGTMLALDKSNGEKIWQSEDITDGAHYASIMSADIHGEHQYIQLTQNTLFGIAAKDGKLLWKSPWPPGRTAVVPTPIVRGNEVYITSGYGAGCKLVRINEDYTAEDVYFNTEMKNHHGGVVLIGDYLYGHSDAGWICQDFATGETKWRERNKLGKGCLTAADGMLYCVDERSGVVALVEATSEAYTERGRFTLPRRSDNAAKNTVWTHPVVVNGKLYLRDQELIFCYDVSAK